MIYITVFAFLCIFQDNEVDTPQLRLAKKRAEAVVQETKRHREFLTNRLESAETKLTAAKRGRVNRKIGNSSRVVKYGKREVLQYTFASKESQDETIADLKGKLDELKGEIDSIDDKTAVVYPKLSANLNIGDFGVFYGNKIYVAQVINKDTMLADLKDPRITVNKEIRVMVRGASTAGLVDDEVFASETVFEVVGTETYKTAIGGTQTVYVLKPLDTQLIDGLIKNPPK